MSQAEIPIRELHARTGQHVRRAATGGRIVVTDRGVPVAELRALPKDDPSKKGSFWEDRSLLPAFASIRDETVGGTDSADAVTELFREREREEEEGNAGP